MNFYAYSRSNPVNLVDPSGEFWNELKSYASGVGNAWGANQIFGIGRSSGGDAYFNAGQTTGDFLSIVTGAMEVYMGTGAAVGGAGGGLALTPATFGTSAVVGAAVAAGGVVVAAHGGSVMLSGEMNLAQSSYNPGSDFEYGTTPDGRIYTKHGYTRANQRDISGEQIDNTINNYTETFDASNGKTGFYESNNDITVITGDDGKIVTTHHGKPAQLNN